MQYYRRGLGWEYFYGSDLGEEERHRGREIEGDGDGMEKKVKSKPGRFSVYRCFCLSICKALLAQDYRLNSEG